MELEYISDLFVENKPSRALRSPGRSQLLKPCVGFSYYAAHRWSKRPVIKRAPTLDTSHFKLKTLLLSCAFV